MQPRMAIMRWALPMALRLKVGGAQLQSVVWERWHIWVQTQGVPRTIISVPLAHVCGFMGDCLRSVDERKGKQSLIHSTVVQTVPLRVASERWRWVEIFLMPLGSSTLCWATSVGGKVVVNGLAACLGGQGSTTGRLGTRKCVEEACR